MGAGVRRVGGPAAPGAARRMERQPAGDRHVGADRRVGSVPQPFEYVVGAFARLELEVGGAEDPLIVRPEVLPERIV
jgi:hypothetical protein